jgi:hypothetical protein
MLGLIIPIAIEQVPDPLAYICRTEFIGQLFTLANWLRRFSQRSLMFQSSFVIGCQLLLRLYGEAICSRISCGDWGLSGGFA